MRRSSTWHTSGPPRRTRIRVSALVVVVLLAGAGTLLGVRGAIAGESVIDLAPTGAPPEQLPAELLACRERVYAGELVALALGIMADHWAVTAHGDERDDVVDPTFEELQVEAAITLPLALQDVERLDGARTGYDGFQGACGDLSEAEVGSLGDEAEACLTRARALRDVVAAGESVEEDWRAHIVLMETAAGAEAGPYLEQWRSQTGAAAESLDAYAVADAELSAAPRCTLD